MNRVLTEAEEARYAEKAAKVAAASLADLLDMEFEELHRELLFTRDQHLIRALREAIRDSDLATLTAAYAETKELHNPKNAPGKDRIAPGSLSAPFRRREALTTYALRAVAAIGLAITVDNVERARACLRSAEEWLRASRLCLPEAVAGLRADSADVTRVLRACRLDRAERVAVLLEPATLSDPVRLTAWIWLLDLAGRLPDRRPGPSCGVLFDRGPEGREARLSFTTLAALPPLLVPDPETMLLCSVDEAFQTMLADVRVVSALHPSTVLWSVTEPREQTIRITGPSIGCAFAVLHRDLRWWRFLQPWVARERTLIVGAVDRAGRVLPVHGYDGKLSMIGSRDRLIVPVENHAEVEELTRKAHVRPTIREAPTVSAASSKSRQPQWRRVATVSVATLVLLLGATGVTTWLQHEAERRTAENLGESEIRNAAKSLMDRATQVKGSDPAAAIRLGTAAVALDPTATARGNLIDLVASTRYLGSAAQNGDTSLTTGIQLSADGKVMLTLTEGNPGNAVLWTSAGGLKPTPHRIPAGNQSVLSPNGKLVATGTGLIDVSDPQNPRQVSTVAAEAAPAVFTPDSTRLIVGTHPPRVFSTADPAAPKRISPVVAEGEDPGTPTMCDATTVAVAQRGSIRLYRLRDRSAPTLLGTIEGDPNRWIGTMACKDRLLVTADGGQIGVGDTSSAVTAWDIENPAKPTLVGALTEQRGIASAVTIHDRTIANAALFHDRTVAVTGTDGTMIAHVAFRPESVRPGFARTATVPGSGAAVFSPDGKTLITGSPGHGAGISLWNTKDLVNEDVTAYPDVPFAQSTSLAGDLLAAPTVPSAMHPGVMLLHVGSDARLSPVATIYLPASGTDDYVPAVALSPNRRTLVTSVPGGARIWNLDDVEHPVHAGDLPTEEPIMALSFTRDPGVLVAIEANGAATVWDVKDPHRPNATQIIPAEPGIPATKAPTAPESAGGMDDDGSGDTGTDTADGSSWAAAAISADAPVMALASLDHSKVALWRMDDPRKPVRAGTASMALTMPYASVNFPEPPALALSADGTRLVTSDGNDPADTLRLWDLTDLDKPVGRALTDAVTAQGAVFGPKGNLLATVAKLSVTQLWDLTDPQHPVQLRNIITQPQGHVAVSNARFTGDGGSVIFASDQIRGFTTAEQTSLSADPRTYACGLVGHGPTEVEWKTKVTGIPWREVC